MVMPQDIQTVEAAMYFLLNLRSPETLKHGGFAPLSRASDTAESDVLPGVFIYSRSPQSLLQVTTRAVSKGVELRELRGHELVRTCAYA